MYVEGCNNIRNFYGEILLILYKKLIIKKLIINIEDNYYFSNIIFVIFLENCFLNIYLNIILNYVCSKYLIKFRIILIKNVEIVKDIYF